MKVKANESPEIQQAETSNRPLDLDRRLIPTKPHDDGKHPNFFSDEMEKVPDYGITLGRLRNKIANLRGEL
jgi:hypothetical protein